MPRFVVPVSFAVTAENLQAARDKVKQVIDHGQAVHGEVEWSWMGFKRRDPPDVKLRDGIGDMPK